MIPAACGARSRPGSRIAPCLAPERSPAAHMAAGQDGGFGGDLDVLMAAGIYRHKPNSMGHRRGWCRNHREALPDLPTRH